MTTCPTCGNPVKIISDKEGTSYYESVPVAETVGAAASVSETFDCRPDKQWLIDAQDKEIEGLERGLEELAEILSARPGETVLEAAKRWRKTVKWYGDLKNWTAPVDMENISESILNGEIATEDDLGQRARELLGD